MEEKERPESNKGSQCVPEDFLAHLLHDLKAPIVTIGGTAKRILEKKVGPISAEQEKSFEIRVADNGRGMERERLEMVLRPFEEVMELRDRELRGFGLGLANVKRYAELHGGALEAKSTPGTGSVFIFRIPLSSSEGGGLRCPRTFPPLPLYSRKESDGDGC